MAERAQTAIDFVVGVGIFVLAVAFVLAFVPSMFAPFFGGGVGDSLVTDRSAAQLADVELVADPATPGVLDKSAVDDFFDSGCDEIHLADRLGIDTERVYVTVGEDWACGPEPAGAETSSQRLVSVDGERHILRVVVWR